MCRIGSGLNLYLDHTESDPGNLAQVNSEISIVHDETNDITYTVDPTGFVLVQSFMQTTADALHGAVREGANRFGDGFSGTGTFAYCDGAPGLVETGPRGWVIGCEPDGCEPRCACSGGADQGVHHKPAGGAWTLNASLEGRYGTEAYAEIRASATAARRF